MNAKLSRQDLVGLGLGSAAALALGAGSARPGRHPRRGDRLPGAGRDVRQRGREPALPQSVRAADQPGLPPKGQQVFYLVVGGATEAPPFPTAPQYLFVSEDEVEEPTTLEGFMAQPKVEGQFVISPTIPGEPDDTPMWHNQGVLAPRDDEPNSSARWRR